MSDVLCKHGWSRRFCEPCSAAAFIASVKGPGDGGMLAIQQELTALRAENERLRAELDKRDPLDAMERGMTPVEAAVWHVWGERCSDFASECLTCRAWSEFDEVKRLRAALWDIHAVCNNWDWFIWMWPIRRIKRIARADLNDQPAPKPRTDARYNNAERIFGDD